MGFSARLSPGLVVGLLALVVAIGGTALAGAPSPTTTAKRSAKVYAQRYARSYARKYAKRGPRGAAGRTGAVGRSGSPGTPGAPGRTGSPGTALGGGGSARIGGSTSLGLANAPVMQLSGTGGQELRLGPGAWKVFGTAVMDVRLSDGATSSQPSCNIEGENTPGFDFGGFPEEAELTTARPRDQLVLPARGEAVLGATRTLDVSVQCSRDGDAAELSGAQLDVWAVPAG